MRPYTSLLVQQLYVWMAFKDSLHTTDWARLANIPSTDKALRDLGTFAFIVFYLLSAGWIHVAIVAELLCLIDILEYLHTEVQGMITSPHLATTVLHDVLRWWYL